MVDGFGILGIIMLRKNFLALAFTELQNLVIIIFVFVQ
jgi:hypothetical protein